MNSLNLVPLALAILVFYLFPLLTTIIMALFGWEKFSWRSTVAIAVAFGGLALALEPRAGNVDIAGLASAFAAALGLAIVIAVSSRIFKAGDARPLTLNMAAVAAVLLTALCVTGGEFQLPNMASGWVGFVSGAVLYGFAMISFYVSVSMIGPVRASLLSPMRSRLLPPVSASPCSAKRSQPCRSSASPSSSLPWSVRRLGAAPQQIGR